MKKVMSSLTAIIIAVFLSGHVYSQSSFSIHAGPSFPLSDFGDDDIFDEDSGLAGTGLSIGGKYLYQLNEKGLGLYVGADFNYNGLKSSVKEDMEDSYNSNNLNRPNVNIKFSKYINVPIVAGLQYSYKANDQISLFGDIGIGTDFLKKTTMTIKDDFWERGMNSKLSTQLAFKIGGGLLIKDKYIIGLDYNGLGEHKIKGEMEIINITGDAWNDLMLVKGAIYDYGYTRLKVSLLTLTLGIKF